MKGVSDRAAVFSIKCACRLNATPKKCRKYIEKNTPDYDPLEINVDIHEILGVRNELKECLEECMNASFFERKFGDCSID